MASIFIGGNVPNRADGMWVIEQKILGAITELGGASITGGGGTTSGTGSPEGVITAPEGTTYLDRSTGNFWAKQTGSGNTGWLQLIG